MIEDKSVTGLLSEALPTAKQKLDGYLGRYKRRKERRDHRPEQRRDRGYANDGWTKMVALYECDLRSPPAVPANMALLRDTRRGRLPARSVDARRKARPRRFRG